MKKAEKAAFEHFYNETERCKDCQYISQHDPNCVKNCRVHRTKIDFYVSEEVEKAMAGGDGKAAAAAGGDGAAGADGGAKPPTAPAGAVEPPPTASADAVKPARCEHCCVNPPDGDSKYCEGCADDLKEEAAANGGEVESPASHVSRSSAEEPLRGAEGASTAPAGAVESPCVKCGDSPACAPSGLCEGCHKDYESYLAQKTQDEQKEHEAEQADKKLKAEAEEYAVKAYHKETRWCAQCHEMKAAKKGNYCAEHKAKVESAFWKYVAEKK
jgi:hypothetical protein